MRLATSLLLASTLLAACAGEEPHARAGISQAGWDVPWDPCWLDPAACGIVTEPVCDAPPPAWSFETWDGSFTLFDAPSTRLAILQTEVDGAGYVNLLGIDVDASRFAWSFRLPAGEAPYLAASLSAKLQSEWGVDASGLWTQRRVVISNWQRKGCIPIPIPDPTPGVPALPRCSAGSIVELGRSLYAALETPVATCQ